MSVLGGLFGSTGTLPLSGGVRENDKLDRIGLQLYTVRDLMEQDFEGTLERVAAIGYRDFCARVPR